MDYIDLSIAYLIDIEGRAIAFQNEHPEIPLHEIALSELNDLQRVREVFTDLGITPTTETEAVIGTRVNRRQPNKEKYDNIVDEAFLADRVRAYLRIGLESGIRFPDRILQYART